jgi:serine/threonine protein kinase
MTDTTASSSTQTTTTSILSLLNSNKNNNKNTIKFDIENNFRQLDVATLDNNNSDKCSITSIQPKLSKIDPNNRYQVFFLFKLLYFSVSTICSMMWNRHGFHFIYVMCCYCSAVFNFRSILPRCGHILNRLVFQFAISNNSTVNRKTVRIIFVKFKNKDEKLYIKNIWDIIFLLQILQ